MIEVTNTGAAKLKFGFCADAVTEVGLGVDLGIGETKSLQVGEFGDFATNHFLNCTNLDVVDGSFSVKVP